MNDQIRELKEQCWVEKRWDSEKELWIDRHIDLEKFAELIIRECADLFEVEWGDEKLTGNDVGYVVKKHFGVEE